MIIRFGPIINLRAVKVKSSECFKLAALAEELLSNRQIESNRRNDAAKIYMFTVDSIFEKLN